MATARRRSKPSSKPGSSRAKSAANSSFAAGRNGSAARLVEAVLDRRDNAWRQIVFRDIDRPGLAILGPAQPVDKLTEAAGMVLVVPGKQFGDLGTVGFGQGLELDLAVAAQMGAGPEPGESAQLLDLDSLFVRGPRHMVTVRPRPMPCQWPTRPLAELETFASRPTASGRRTVSSSAAAPDQ